MFYQELAQITSFNLSMKRLMLIIFSVALCTLNYTLSIKSKVCLVLAIVQRVDKNVPI